MKYPYVEIEDGFSGSWNATHCRFIGEAHGLANIEGRKFDIKLHSEEVRRDAIVMLARSLTFDPTPLYNVRLDSKKAAFKLRQIALELEQ